MCVLSFQEAEQAADEEFVEASLAETIENIKTGNTAAGRPNAIASKTSDALDDGSDLSSSSSSSSAMQKSASRGRLAQMTDAAEAMKRGVAGSADARRVRVLCECSRFFGCKIFVAIFSLNYL